MPILRQQKERWMPIASNLLTKTANRRPSSFWAYLTKQITSSYMQVPEDLQVFIVNLQVHLQVPCTIYKYHLRMSIQVRFKCSYKCSFCLIVNLTVIIFLDSSFFFKGILKCV
jgi:radical SAM superfamily enzyme YgiQ (UPF0313 family)